MMNNDRITITLNGIKKEYKLLLIIQKDYYYIIYTDINNTELNKNLYVAKVDSLENINSTLPINDLEWLMLEEEYTKIIKGI